MATLLSFSISHTTTASTFRSKVSAMATSPPTKMTPVIIISGRKVGKTLQDMGTGQDLVVQRRESMALNFEGLVLVCTWIDDLEFVVQSTPPSRWPGEYSCSRICYL